MFFMDLKSSRNSFSLALPPVSMFGRLAGGWLCCPVHQEQERSWGGVSADRHQGSRPGHLLKCLTSQQLFPEMCALSFTSSRLFLSLCKGVICIMNQTQGPCLCKCDQRLISAGAGCRCPPGGNGEMSSFLARVGCCTELGPPHLSVTSPCPGLRAWSREGSSAGGNAHRSYRITARKGEVANQLASKGTVSSNISVSESFTSSRNFDLHQAAESPVFTIVKKETHLKNKLYWAPRVSDRCQAK